MQPKLTNPDHDKNRSFCSGGGGGGGGGRGIGGGGGGGGGGGTWHMKGVGMLLEIETHLGVAQAFADP